MNKKNTVSFADIETDSFSDDFSTERIEQIHFKLGCVITYDENLNEIDRFSTYNLKDFCIKLNSLNIVYFHNLSFDLKFIQKELLSLNTKFKVVNTANSTLIASFFKFKTKKESKTVELRDSLAMLKSSVLVLGKNINLPKLEVKNNNYVDLAYCFRDCEIVAYSMFNLIKFCKEHFNYELKLYKIPSTTASLSKKLFCEIYPNAFYRFDYKINEKIRKYYFGGRTEVFNFETLRNGYYVDVVSLYPSICCNYDLPNGCTYWFEVINFKESELLKDKRIFAFECIVNENQQIPLFPSRLDDKVCFYNGKKKVFMTIYEYKELKELGVIPNEIIIEQITAITLIKERSNFHEFFNPLFQTKKNTLDKGVRFFCKIFMNALTGKFGQKIDREYYLYFNELDIDFDKDFYFDIDLDASYTIIKEKQRFQTNNLLTVIAITNLARFTLWKQLRILNENNAKFYYCDTDSIVVNRDSLKYFELGNELGCWDIETEYKFFQAIDSKEYITVNNKSELLIKFKGLITKHLTETDFFNHYVDGTITRVIPKTNYCSIRKIENESIVFLKKHKKQYYFKRVISKDLSTIPLNLSNLRLDSVKDHNKLLIYNKIIIPNINKNEVL